MMTNSSTIDLRPFADLHLHARRKGAKAWALGSPGIMEVVLPHTAAVCEYGLIMPNCEPHICTGADARAYRTEMMDVLGGKYPHFTPLLTIYINAATNRKVVAEARDDVVAAKLYPQGVTTGSASGVTDFLSDELVDVYRALADNGLKLCVHGEMPKVNDLDAEAAFLDIFAQIIKAVPDLQIVFEHISSIEAVRLVQRLNSPNVVATVTAHHLRKAYEDVFYPGGFIIDPHSVCKPVAKQRLTGFLDLIWQVIGDGDERFFLGSDSAPHRLDHKHCGSGCSYGAYTAVALPQLIVSDFGRRNLLHRLPGFTSDFGRKFYGLTGECGQKLRMVKRPYTVPGQVGNGLIIPFEAGTVLDWDVEGLVTV